jgi:hypothetical protein
MPGNDFVGAAATDGFEACALKQFLSPTQAGA